MGMWNTHGMHPDEEEQMGAVGTLGFMPEELEVLADNAEKEAWIMRQVAKQAKGQIKRKRNLIANHWMRRARRFRELAALLEHDVTEQIEADKEISS